MKTVGNTFSVSAHEKLSYRAPELISLGTVQQFVQAGGGTIADDGEDFSRTASV